jgi:hypothetical protein
MAGYANFLGILLPNPHPAEDPDLKKKREPEAPWLYSNG